MAASGRTPGRLSVTSLVVICRRSSLSISSCKPHWRQRTRLQLASGASGERSGQPSLRIDPDRGGAPGAADCSSQRSQRRGKRKACMLFLPSGRRCSGTDETVTDREPVINQPAPGGTGAHRAGDSDHLVDQVRTKGWTTLASSLPARTAGPRGPCRRLRQHRCPPWCCQSISLRCFQVPRSGQRGGSLLRPR